LRVKQDGSFRAPQANIGTRNYSERGGEVKLKHLEVKKWVEQRDSSFTAAIAAEQIGCSKSTVYVALDRHFTGKIHYYVCPDGHGNFERVFFPLGWTVVDCRAYTNRRTKTGKSRATLYLMGVGDAENPNTGDNTRRRS
jgi:hypothetical protein